MRWKWSGFLTTVRNLNTCDLRWWRPFSSNRILITECGKRVCESDGKNDICIETPGGTAFWMWCTVNHIPDDERFDSPIIPSWHSLTFIFMYQSIFWTPIFDVSVQIFLRFYRQCSLRISAFRNSLDTNMLFCFCLYPVPGFENGRILTNQIINHTQTNKWGKGGGMIWYAIWILYTYPLVSKHNVDNT